MGEMIAFMDLMTWLVFVEWCRPGFRTALQERFP